MAERRMFAKTIIDSDAFLDMPLSTQALYFHLSMRADDDGFINNPKRIQRVIGAADDDLKVLIAKNFIIPFETGIVVIKHWRIHNYLRNDRYTETVYKEEKEQLMLKENKAYTLKNQAGYPVGIPSGIPNGYQTDAQYSIDEVSLDKDSINNPKRKRFTPPTLEEVRQYCEERKNGIDAEHFIDYYAARGWELKQGQKVKDWKACVRTWEQNRKTPSQPMKTVNAQNYNQRTYTEDELEARATDILSEAAGI